jgi:hypothetical protein
VWFPASGFFQSLEFWSCHMTITCVRSCLNSLMVPWTFNKILNIQIMASIRKVYFLINPRRPKLVLMVGNLWKLLWRLIFSQFGQFAWNKLKIFLSNFWCNFAQFLNIFKTLQNVVILRREVTPKGRSIICCWKGQPFLYPPTRTLFP